MILYCGCTTGPDRVTQGVVFQDAKYGVGKRVHTKTAKEKPEVYRCTICRKERTKPGAAEKSANEKLAVSKK